MLTVGQREDQTTKSSMPGIMVCDHESALWAWTTSQNGILDGESILAPEAKNMGSASEATCLIPRPPILDGETCLTPLQVQDITVSDVDER